MNDLNNYKQHRSFLKVRLSVQEGNQSKSALVLRNNSVSMRNGFTKAGQWQWMRCSWTTGLSLSTHCVTAIGVGRCWENENGMGDARGLLFPSTCYVFLEALVIHAFVFCCPSILNHLLNLLSSSSLILTPICRKSLKLHTINKSIKHSYGRAIDLWCYFYRKWKAVLITGIVILFQLNGHELEFLCLRQNGILVVVNEQFCWPLHSHWK